jgi:hypothetical protein
VPRSNPAAGLCDGRKHKIQDMAWNDKAKQIAEQVYDKMHKETSTDKEHLLEMLEKAALTGMEYECDEWCHGKSARMQECCETIMELLK